MKRIDLLHHAIYSFALAIAGAFLMGPLWGISVAALLGVAKELWDGMPPRRRFCWWDMTANGVGILAAVMVMRGWGV